MRNRLVGAGRRAEPIACRIIVAVGVYRGGSTRQSWMETSGLWPIFHREWQGISQVKSNQHKIIYNVDFILILVGYRGKVGVQEYRWISRKYLHLTRRLQLYVAAALCQWHMLMKLIHETCATFLRKILV